MTTTEAFQQVIAWCNGLDEHSLAGAGMVAALCGFTSEWKWACEQEGVKPGGELEDGQKLRHQLLDSFINGNA